MPDAPRPTLPRSARLRSRKEFARVFEARNRAAEAGIVLHAAPTDLAWSRLGISVSRRVGNAVRRNRIKRLVREAFRRMRHEWPPGVDWVVVPQPGANLTVFQLGSTLQRLTQRLIPRVEAIRAKRKHQVP